VGREEESKEGRLTSTRKGVENDGKEVHTHRRIAGTWVF